MSAFGRCFALAWLGVHGCGSPPLSPSDPSSALGRVAVPMEATALDGASLALPEPGHVTVVELWATWCEPCRASIPDVEQVWRDGRGDVSVVGIATDDNPGLVASAVTQRAMTFPNVVDAGGEVRGWLHASELPTIVVFDRHGRMRWIHRGAAPGALGDVVATLERE